MGWNDAVVADGAAQKVIGANIEETAKSFEEYRALKYSNCTRTRNRIMSSIRKIGGYAAVIQGLGFVCIPVFIFILEIPHGLGPGADAAKEFAVAAASAIPYLLLNLLVILPSITIVLNALALLEHMREGAPNRMRLAISPPQSRELCSWPVV